MEKLRILIFNWRCWLNPAMGGAEVFTREVLERWVKGGHEVTLFTSQFEGSKEEEVVDGVRIVRRGGRLSVYGQAKKTYADRFSKESFDVVVDEINTRPFMTPKFVSHNERVVALIHQLAREYWFYETPFPASYLGRYFLEERWLKNYSDIPTVTVSESTKEDLLNMGFGRIFVVGEGLNFEPLAELGEKTTQPVAVYAGRLTRAKRPDHAIKASEIVRETLSDAELWIIGTGNFEGKLSRMAGEGVRFLGSTSNERRRELIKKAWVLVNPSVREGFGLNIIEANALGVPCVAYDVPGLRDAIVPDETGLLVKSGDIEELGKAVCRVLTDKPLRIRLSEKALVYSRSFSWDDVADKFLEVIEAA
jgi:glycosyltransferase involved in cell wall biosynthesis